MQKLFEKLTVEFRRHNGILTQEQFEYIIKHFSDLEEDRDIALLILQASGYPIEFQDDRYILSTYFRNYTNQKFCVIDIETNGSKPDNSQVIEIGAIMVEDGEIVDKFESFVECAFLPEYITKITGIEPSDLIDAPTQKEVLTKLREFIGDSIFVAHNVKFDYSFLNASFKRFGLGEIGNQKLCTIDLAKRTFESQKYGLAYLIETLKLDATSHHRAYSDAFCAYQVMKKSWQNVPHYVNSSDELLQFASSNRRTRREKKES